MTGRKFAAWAGIKYSTFSNWLGVRRKAASAEPPKAEVEHATGTRWLEAVVNAPQETKPVKSGNSVLIVHGPGGVRLELSEETQVSWASRLLRELTGKPEC